MAGRERILLGCKGALFHALTWVIAGVLLPACSEGSVAAEDAGSATSIQGDLFSSADDRTTTSSNTHAGMSTSPTTTSGVLSQDSRSGDAGVGHDSDGGTVEQSLDAGSEASEGAGTSSTDHTTDPPPVDDDPLILPEMCSSGQYWTRGENERMRPGEACISCHTREGEGPRYKIAGTLYPTGHEPDDCYGSSSASGAEVVITDANGEEHTLRANEAGNFFLTGSLALPYTAKVVSAVGERSMLTPQTSGDCNSCHTKAGNGAPGRVVVP